MRFFDSWYEVASLTSCGIADEKNYKDDEQFEIVFPKLEVAVRVAPRLGKEIADEVFEDGRLGKVSSVALGQKVVVQHLVLQLRLQLGQL